MKALTLLATVLMLVGCGDDGKDGDSDGDGGAGGGPTGSCSDDDSMRCAEEIYAQRCEDGDWATVETCDAESGESCSVDDSTGVASCVQASDCDQDAQRCFGNVVSVCNEGQWETQTACSETQSCVETSDTQAECQEGAACQEGDQHCADNEVQVCTDGEFVTQATCSGSQMCVETSSTTAECQSSGALQVATTGVGRKVQPTTEVGSLQTVRLAGARGSVQSFQIIIHGNGGPLDAVTASTSPLEDGSGNSLSADEITLFREAFIDFAGVDSQGGALPAPESSPTGDSLVPDPLIPLFDPYTGEALGQPFAVSSGENQALFVDVNIPLDATAGTYQGAVTVTDGTNQVDVPIELLVWDLTLPDMNVVTTHFRLSGDEVKKYHADTYECYSGPDDCWVDANLPAARTIVKRYEELLHSHRIDPGQFFSGDGPSNCTGSLDWSEYDASMEPYMDGSYFEDGVPSGRMSTPFSPGVDWGPEGECSEQEYTELAAAWADHLKEKGWFDRAIVYASDEPDAELYPVIAQHSSWMQNGDPDWKSRIMVTTAPTTSNIDTLGPAIGVFCVAPEEYDHWYQGNDEIFGRAEWPDLFTAGTQLWFYESNNQNYPYPTFASQSLDGLESTMMLWASFYERATGFLYWDTVYWTEDDPWGPNNGFGKTGDGMLIYPGNHNGLVEGAGSPPDVAMDGPIPSYRLKMVRMGLQDFALFKLAEQHDLGDFAREQLSTVYHWWGGCEWDGCAEPEDGFYWRTDEDAMQSIRTAIAEAIVGG